MITKKQFDILTFLEDKNETYSQRDIASALGISLGGVNKLIKELNELGYCCENKITDEGVKALEPYRVKRAVFIAAGFGSRMVPITLNTPKPLVRVHGKKIIETLLDAVVEAQIEEIVIVRGYLGEQFDQLLKKYPNIKFIENTMFNETNNISSVYLCRELLQNAYILEGDLVLHNPKLITKYQYETNYLGIPVESTDDWCFYAQDNGVVKKMAIGGTNCHKMVGISYWTAADGARLSEDVAKVFTAPGGKERYWDQVALEYHLGEYDVHIRECSQDDIVEIDTFNELKAIDSIYDI